MKKLFFILGMLFLFTFITPKESISAPSSTPAEPYVTYTLPAPLPGSVEPYATYTLPAPLPEPSNPCITVIFYCPDGVGHTCIICDYDDYRFFTSYYCGACD